MTDIERYGEVLVEVGKWKLLKKTVDDPGPSGRDSHYKSMMWHKCTGTGGYDMRNGAGKQTCYGCKEHVPDEIWGLWLLHNGGI